MTARIVIVGLLALLALAPVQGKLRMVDPQPTVSDAAATGPGTAPATGPTTQAAIDQAQLSNALVVLKENKISDQADDLLKYLADLLPNAEQTRKAYELIRLLGSDDWRTREQATQDLMKLPVLPVDELRKAAQSADQEVQTRANEILQKCEGKRPQVLGAIFKVIAIRKPGGFVQPIIRTLPCCSQDEYLFKQAVEALSAVSKPADAPSLRKLLGEKDPMFRRAGVGALAAVLGKAAEDDILKMLQDPDEKVQLDAAIAIANMGNRKSLSALLKLMESQELGIRGDSYGALASLTGKDLPFAPFGAEGARAKSLEAWKAFIEKDGDKIALRLPLRMDDGESFLFGNTLIGTGEMNQVIELDAAGREVWKYTGGKGVWCAEKLRNGNYLLACVRENKAKEVTAAGETVWEYEDAGMPIRARQLANGNYLIALYLGNVARELDRQKNVVWEYKTPGNCCDARRLPNGNTLIASNVGIQEVTPDGTVIWEAKDKGMAYTAQRLPNGNTLVALLNGSVVEELDPQKKVVWSHKHDNPADAFRLPNGNTLITGSQKAVEVTPDGKEVWSRSGFNYGTVRK